MQFKSENSIHLNHFSFVLLVPITFWPNFGGGLTFLRSRGVVSGFSHFKGSILDVMITLESSLYSFNTLEA